jgi:NAD(P)-dependent dehydrogenase (short-subunit alcohol dehydrogenase family)
MKTATISAFITGGASGLGEATVRRLVANGAQVAIVDRDEERGAALASELGGKTFFVKTDVTSEAEVQQAVHKAVDHFGSLNVVVNAAGVGSASRVLSKHGPMPLDIFSMTIQINLIGSFNVIRLSAQAMQQNTPNEEGERGVIINTASVAAFDGQIGQAAYSASKGGVVGMTLPIAREFAQLGIRVVTIAPGLFDTPMMAMLPEAARISLGEQVPFPRRLGKPEEYAALAHHIMENPMLNGEVIRLDGAIRMAPK